MAIFNMIGGEVPQDYIADTGTLSFDYNSTEMGATIKAPDGAKSIAGFYLVSDLSYDDNTSVEMIVYPVSQKSQRFGLYYHRGSIAASWIRGDPTLSDGKIEIYTSSFYVDTGGDVYFRGNYLYYIIYKTK